MRARSKARKRAVDVLFEADLRGLDAVSVLADRLAGGDSRDPADPPIPDYTVTLVEGVVEHAERIDELIETYSEGWRIDRMPVVDRTILRLGVYELLWAPDVPDAVVADEAVELAKSLSTEDSPAFVNGLLARLILLKPSLTG